MASEELANWQRWRTLRPWGAATLMIVITAASSYGMHLIGFDRTNSSLMFFSFCTMAPILAVYGVYWWREQERRYQLTVNAAEPRMAGSVESTARRAK